MRIPPFYRTRAKEALADPQKLQDLAECFEPKSTIYKKLTSGKPTLYIVASALDKIDRAYFMDYNFGTYGGAFAGGDD